MNRSLRLIISLALPFTAALIGSWATSSALNSWYMQIEKPSFNPPGWIFGPVWTVLYLMMGVALYLIWKNGIKSPAARFAITLFIIQLALNALWSILFFGMHNPLLALVDIVILWGFILLTIIKFYPLNTLAAYLLIPYLAWVSFATLLNFSIWQLNA